MGIGSGSATARESIIMAKLMVTFKGSMVALFEEDEIRERFSLVCSESD